MIYTNTYGSKLYNVRNVRTLKELFNSSVELYRDRKAFLVKDYKAGPYREISYGEAKQDIDALGTKILDLGLQGKKIAIIGENSYQWIISYFAIVNGGGIVVPLDKELSKEEVYNLIETAECSAVFYSSSYEKYFKDYAIPFKFHIEMYGGRRTNIPGSWGEMVESGRKLLEAGDKRFVDAEIDPGELKIMLFTSGTTGAAKAVMLNHRNLTSDIMSTSKIVKLREDDVALSILPIHHTFESTLGIMTILYQGGSVAFYEGLKYVTKNLAEAKCSILVGVPLIFESIYQKIWKQAEKTGKLKALKAAVKLNKTLKSVGIDAHWKIFKSVYENFGGRLRLLITGAAAIDPKVLRGFQDLGFEVCQGYGLTETAPLLAGMPDFVDRYSKAGSCGPVIPDGELQIIDKNEENIGEIIYRGPNVMMGYYNMPEKTAEVLKDGWFHTGDLGFVDEQGWLYITGRKKNIIVTKTGKNIYPEELETSLNKIKYIEECMVYGMDGEDSEDMVVAVQIRPNYELIYEEFGEGYDADGVYALMKKHISELNQTLPNYKRIRSIQVRNIEFVKTTTKKIKRQENI